MHPVERVALGTFPTPLHELVNLSRLLDGPRLFIKRDDLTGLALGGNKVRKLEYILAEARSKQADVIITVGAVSSNHTRQTAAAAALLGIECDLVLIGREPKDKQGNYLLDHLLGARTHCVRNRDIDDTIQDLVAQKIKAGKKPYVIPAGGHTLLGAISYRDAYLEMKAQSPVKFDTVVTAVGTGTTYAGLYLGSRLFKDQTEVIGISVGGNLAWCQEQVLSVLHPLEHEENVTPSKATDLSLYEDYIGEGYTRPYPRVREIINLLARTEGILLDPVYTGKAMVGLIDLIEKKKLVKGQNVVFLHTGGAPELFSMNQFLVNNE
ncbi:MAG: D-cysteine desulfhydrase family protein [Bacillota bacterium]|nr:D-cysteine desulfhydrase family protein [Bacillota bacterium]